MFYCVNCSKYPTCENLPKGQNPSSYSCSELDVPIPKRIIALDFDGTLCENAYPEIGAPRESVIAEVKKAIEEGARIILWTCRCGPHLAQALDFCYTHGIHLDAVNENIPEILHYYKGESRKVSATEYWDDRAYNPVS